MQTSESVADTVSSQLSKLAQLDITSWCTPGVHAPEETGVNRRTPDAGFTLRPAVRA